MMRSARRSIALLACSLSGALLSYGGSSVNHAAGSDFGFRLIKTTNPSTAANYLLSPFSAQVALAMLAPGMHGSERATLTNVISLSPGQAKKVANGHSELSVANSVWVDSRMKITAAYESAVKADFGATVKSFSHDHASLDRINNWVDTNTKHRIPTILDSFKEGDRLILINAIAFDGEWAKQFDKAQTRPQEFHPVSKAAYQTPMMHMNESVPYIKQSDLRAIRLDYKGHTFSMVLMLPEGQKDATLLLKNFSSAKMSSLLGSMNNDKVQITLPKFKYTDSRQLGAPLIAMGLGSLFNEADFSGISSGLRRGRIDRVIQKTYVEVDEKGTKAAAATGVVMQPTMVRMNSPEFVADRPFAFLIIDNAAHNLLFAGVVNHP